MSAGPSKEVCHAVRQVLMNELGLTRDSVREVMREIITDTATRYMGQGQGEQLREQLVRQVVERAFQRGGDWRKTIESEVVGMIRARLAEQVKGLMEGFEVVVRLKAQADPSVERAVDIAVPR